jgi:hypothetical protein
VEGENAGRTEARVLDVNARCMVLQIAGQVGITADAILGERRKKRKKFFEERSRNIKLEED